MKKRCLKHISDTLSSIVINIQRGHKSAAIGQAITLRGMINCYIDQKNAKKKDCE